MNLKSLYAITLFFKITKASLIINTKFLNKIISRSLNTSLRSRHWSIKFRISFLCQLMILTLSLIFFMTSRSSSSLNHLSRMRSEMFSLIAHCALKKHCHLIINSSLIDSLLCSWILVMSSLNSLVLIALTTLIASAISIILAIENKSLLSSLFFLHSSNLFLISTKNS